MKVKVNVHDRIFVVPCGEGGQTMKWLAMVAAQRYALAVPNGRSRAREESHSKRGFFLPEMLWTEGQLLTNPEARISDIMEDGAVINVNLQQNVELDDVGAPKLSAWAEHAFSHSNASKMRVEIAKRRQAAADREVERQAIMERRQKEYASRKSQGAMHVVVAGDLESNEDVEAALMYDLNTLDLRAIEKSPVQHKALRLVLLEHFRMLNSIFIHYCGVARPGHIFGMCYDEFAHFLHLCNMCHARHDEEALRGIFAESASNRLPGGLNSSAPIPKLLSRADFVYGIMRAAASLATGGAADTVDAIEDALLEKIQPGWEAYQQDAILQAMSEKSTQAMIQDNRTHLKRVFEQHSRPEDGPGQTANRDVMLLEGLKDACEESGLLAEVLAEERADEKARKICLNAVLSAQNDPEEVRELPEVAFMEFVHAVARIAVEVLESKDVQQKIRIGIDYMLEYSLSL
eukprot:CAMPEP_0119476528 /NCGR_PEP_ID=MMETSP1344-20130328/7012_1 /TAXON_ID=236787 /ORGANISM="Florenciella parvula, Strain CCMP2471" /LENGTH=460 /DNA_ID=CAMNT_0007510309 /DNA_START=108 /DNA_END=1490 /DNA_ORIENTATION=-